MKNLQAAQAVAVAGLQPVLQVAGSSPGAVYPFVSICFYNVTSFVCYIMYTPGDGKG
jgi:hypothetical protein